MIAQTQTVFIPMNLDLLEFLGLLFRFHAGSFAGMVFLSWYMSGKLRAFDHAGHVAKLCIVFLPLLAAALVGVSRIDDYWHHWQDVFAGAIIGRLHMSPLSLQEL